MRVIRWESPSRTFSNGEVSDFYDRPLDSPHLFRFSTNATELPEHGGCLSLKVIISGEEEYRIHNRRVVLRPGQFLVINAGQHYASRIRQPTESLSIFFPTSDHEGLNEAIRLKLHGRDSTIAVPQVSFPANQGSQRALRGLIRILDHEPEIDPREASQQLMMVALKNLHDVVPFSRLKSALKTSTRHELARRVLKVKERIDDTSGQTTDLDDMAATACLSKYYFLRVFTEIFAVSPGAYARRVRLKHAAKEIATGGDPRREASAAGYRDFRAFRRACIRSLGFDPTKSSQ